jgi:type IV pilus assembly protein PilQ
MVRVAGVVVAVVLVGAGVAAAEEREEPCRGARRYRGPEIALDVKDADLHDVFRLLADAGDVNIVVPDDVEGAITLRLKRVPWEQALCTVVRAKKLDVWREGSIYSVVPR